MPSEKDLIREIETHARTLAQAMAAAEVYYEQYTQEIEHTLQECLAANQAEYDQTMDHLQQEHTQAVAAVRQELQEVEQACGQWATPWDDRTWETHQPDPAAAVPYLTRLGKLEMRYFSGAQASTLAEVFDEKRQPLYRPHPLDIQRTLTMPALLPITGGCNVLIKAAGGAKARAVQGVQSLILRLLATIPPGKLRLLLVDPVGLGQNVAGFMHLADYVEELVGGKAWTEPTHIEQQLADLSAHMEMVIQKYLRNRYATMEDYNAEAGEVAEPYRLLVAMNFPVNFDDTAARRLVSIATNGPRCGVYVLATVDTEQPLPHGFNLADLERTATVVAWDGQRFVWQDDDFRDATLEMDAPPPMEQFERLVRAVGAAAKEASKVEVPFKRIIPPPEAWWQAETRRGIRAPIGRVGARGIQYFEIGEGTAQHALVAGRTGSGKSNFMHVLINSLVTTYPPEELELYLIDFKKGVEFKPYAVHQLPHARVVAIESEREFGLSVLEGLDAELQRRGETFRRTGCNDVEEYRRKVGERLPRILLVVDEFQEFFTYDDRLATQANLILDRLARQGRAFGIHVLLGSQTLHGAYTLARSTMDQMAVRIALQCSDADSRLILADDNPAARLLSRPGEAIYNAASGLVEGNTLFQIAWLPDEEREDYPRLIREVAEGRGSVTRPPIVFEGNEPARLEENQALQSLLAAPTWPERPRRVPAWLGEPVAIKPPTTARFRRMGGSHLLVVGRDEGAATGILTAVLVSLAAQHRPEEVRFEVIDLTTYDAPWAEVPETLAELLPHPLQVLGRRDVAGIVAEIQALVQERLEEERPGGPAIYLAVLGLHRARALRQEEGALFPRYDEEAPPSPSQQLATILQEGPEVDVHVLAWCDTYASLTRALDRRTLGELGMRVALPMSGEESNNLLDDSAAAKLGQPNRAIFYDEEQVGALEKFRPYQVPPLAWLESVGRILRER